MAKFHFLIISQLTKQHQHLHGTTVLQNVKFYLGTIHLSYHPSLTHCVSTQPFCLGNLYTFESSAVSYLPSHRAKRCPRPFRISTQLVFESKLLTPQHCEKWRRLLSTPGFTCKDHEPSLLRPRWPFYYCNWFSGCQRLFKPKIYGIFMLTV